MAEIQRNRDSVKRLQVGVTGLSLIVLLLGLVNIVVQNVKQDAERVAEAPVVANAVNAVEEAPSEPLAELGVTPAPSETPPVVPDLEPDPKLTRPMDREPATRPAAP